MSHKKRASEPQTVTKYPAPNWAVGQVTRINGLVEDTCKHGVGHPNADFLSINSQGKDWMKAYSTHGCDGCCGEPDFKVDFSELKDVIDGLVEDYQKKDNSEWKNIVERLAHLGKDTHESVKELLGSVKLLNTITSANGLAIQQLEKELNKLKGKKCKKK